MVKRCLLCLIALSLSAAQAEPVVRVLLERLPNYVQVDMNGPHRGYVDNVYSFATDLPLSWPVSAGGDTLWVDGRRMGETLTLESDSGVVTWRDRSYRGALSLRADGSDILVINSLNLEDYLRSVVPSEMQASWPLEALKAQAVAARSYLLSSYDAASPYDICATTDCQVYKGLQAEHPRSSQAIDETRGLVLSYDGTVARTYYHADSGGFTASGEEVWGVDKPYLQARTDVAMRSPHRDWQRRIDPDKIAASLTRMGVDIGVIEAFRILAVSESGRVERAQVVGSDGATLLEGKLLTKLLRLWGMKSTRFEMVGGLTVRGNGWGHGVGMSQYGARSMARSQHSFDAILTFYYPGTAVTAYPDTPLAASEP